MALEPTLYKLIVGLGNPGAEYCQSRHNLGFMVIEAYAKANNLNFTERFESLVARFDKKGIILAKPMTYMNRSGISISAIIKNFGILPEDILVVHDDIDMNLGRIKLSKNGGSGGHRGIESIINALSTKEFVRLKIGVGRPKDSKEMAIKDYVLSTFEPETLSLLNEIIARATHAIDLYLEKGLERAMSVVNDRSFSLIANNIKEVKG